jgi:predicted nucleic acid-binding protein
MRVYLDTCIVIYLVGGTAPFQAAAVAALQSVAVADELCISDLVRMECLVRPIRMGDETQRTVFERQLSLFSALPMTSPVFELATELRARHGLKTPDALHAACALHHGCDQLWTNDHRFASLTSRLPIRIVH